MSVLEYQLRLRNKSQPGAVAPKFERGRERVMTSINVALDSKSNHTVFPIAPLASMDTCP